MSMNKARRRFMVALGLGGAAAAAALLARQAAGEAAPAQNEVQSKGYQTTSHVRNYYRTTRV